MNKYNFKSIVKLHNEKNKQISYWQIYISNPQSCLITYFFLNYKLLTPNIITALGFLFFLISLYFIFISNYILASIFYQLSFVMDIVDGNIARLKNQTSLLGAFLDSIIDWIKPSFLFLFAFFIDYNFLFIVIIILNFLAAGAWRIRDGILLGKNYIYSNKLKFQKNKLLEILKKVNSIEVEALISVFYFLTLSDLFIYFSLAIVFKNLVFALLSSLFILNSIDKNSK